MKAIKIKIVSFISNDQPGWVECKFIDAWNREHTIHDKVPIVTDQYLDEKSDYPRDGVVACELIKKWIDQNGRKIFTVTTDRPWSIDTLEGLSEFDLLELQLTELKR
ncbi:MAG: hypothetical protein HXX16_19110 [Bacteroidales bacterium]|nr:hypothetical protein [Bacteroidales bacterium]